MNLEQLNAWLKAAKLGVTVEARGKGKKLSLRATLPPKTGTGSWKQQYIPLGFYDNPAGIKKAKKEALKLSAQLASKEFKWSDWMELENEKSQVERVLADTVSAWIERYKIEYFNRRSRTPKSETTWRTDYKQPFGQLPPDALLTAKILRDSILKTEPDTRNRQRRCMALGRLAEFAGIELDVKSLRGKYSPKQVNPRDLPTDKEISEWRDRIYEKNEAWGWAFGMMACYGLRNHELFYLDLDRLKQSPVLSIIEHDNGNTPKTGIRRVWACYPEWWDKWRLWNVKLPDVTGKTNSDLGHRVTNQFRRYDFLKPYNLRHRWAVRTIEFGIPPELAAIQMGHSYQVHSEVYHHWIGDDVHQRAFDIAMQRADRPLPP